MDISKALGSIQNTFNIFKVCQTIIVKEDMTQRSVASDLISSFKAS